MCASFFLPSSNLPRHQSRERTIHDRLIDILSQRWNTWYPYDEVKEDIEAIRKLHWAEMSPQLVSAITANFCDWAVLERPDMQDKLLTVDGKDQACFVCVSDFFGRQKKSESSFFVVVG